MQINIIQNNLYAIADAVRAPFDTFTDNFLKYAKGLH